MSMNKLYAGVYRQLLTPKRDTYLGGYADIDNEMNLCRVPDDVLGDVYARVLVIDDGDTRICFLDIDAAILNEGENYPVGTRERLASLAGTPVDQFYIFTNHNHQSFKYLSETEIKLIETAVVEAVKALVPCKYGLVECINDIGVNRRPRYVVSEHLPFDNRMLITKLIREDDGAPLALIFNYPIHNTALGTARPENWHIMTSELTGFAVLKIEEIYKAENPQFTAFHFNGFYGAAGPNINGNFTAEHSMIKQKGEKLGKEIADYSQRIIANGTGRITAKKHSERFALREEYGTQEGTITFYGIKLAELAFLGADCEPFVDIGAKIRAYSPFDDTILMANVNGFSGYIPTKKAFFSGLNEAETQISKTPYTYKAEKQFISASQKLLSDLKSAGECRIIDAVMKKVTEVGEWVCCNYRLAQQTNIIRVILDFGEESRFDCAESFDILFYDQEQRLVLKKSVENNSINMIGIPVKAKGIAGMDVVVKRLYKNRKNIKEMNCDVRVIEEND